MSVSKKQIVAHTKLVFLIILIAFFINIFPCILKGKPFSMGFGSDQGTHTANVLLISKPHLMERDFAIREFSQMPRSHKRIYNFLALIINATGKDTIQVAFLFSVFCYFIFLIGCYFLFYYLTKSKIYGLLFALLSFSRLYTLGTFSWGIPYGLLLPKAVALSLVPWLFIAFFHFHKNRYSFLLYGVLGLLTNLYPIQFIHLAIIFGIIEVLESRSIRTLKKLLLGVLFFIVGSIPQIYTYWHWYSGNLLGYTDQFTQSIRAMRFSYYVPKPLGVFFDNNKFFWTLYILGTFCFFMKRKFFGLNSKERQLGFLLLVSVILSLFGIFVLQRSQKFWSFMFARFSALSYIAIFYFILWYVMFLFKKKRLIAIIFALFIMATSFTFRPKVMVFTYQTIFHPEWKIVFNRQAKDLYRLGQWAKINTPEDSIFLFPMDIPSEYKSMFQSFYHYFRLYSERGVLLTTADAFRAFDSSEIAKRWYSLYEEIDNIYKTKEPAEFYKLSTKYNVNYIVIDKIDKIILDFPVVFENSSFIAYKAIY